MCKPANKRRAQDVTNQLLVLGSILMPDGSEIILKPYEDNNKERRQANESYGEAAQVINKSGQWTDWYRDAVNEKEESLGNHEVKTLKLGVKNNLNGDII